MKEAKFRGHDIIVVSRLTNAADFNSLQDLAVVYPIEGEYRIGMTPEAFDKYLSLLFTEDELKKLEGKDGS